jgi:hypothetical protein
VRQQNISNIKIARRASSQKPHPSTHPTRRTITLRKLCQSPNSASVDNRRSPDLSRLPNEMSRGWKITNLKSAAGAKRGAIIGRHAATHSLVRRSKDAPELLSSHSEPHWATVAASFA